MINFTSSLYRLITFEHCHCQHGIDLTEQNSCQAKTEKFVCVCVFLMRFVWSWFRLSVSATRACCRCALVCLKSILSHTTQQIHFVLDFFFSSGLCCFRRFRYRLRVMRQNDSLYFDFEIEFILAI